MNKRLIIIGASAMGRETCAWATEAGFSVAGFLDNRLDILNGYDSYPPIIGDVENYKPESTDVFVCAVGDSHQRKFYCEIIQAKGGAFVSVIHPRATIGSNVTLGEGCIIAPNTAISNDTMVGKHVILNLNASISHDCKIGDYVSVSPGCNIAGWCNIGAFVFMGVQSALIPHVSLGDFVFVAAGAIVTKKFSSGKLMGVPASNKTT